MTMSVSVSDWLSLVWSSVDTKGAILPNFIVLLFGQGLNPKL